jgi:hypothetical protein
MTNRLRVTAKEDDELHGWSSRGLVMINICRTEKRWLLLLNVIHASRSGFCATDEIHRRFIAHRRDMEHRA